MTKAIKFNLILDKFPVRNLEELQEHFSIEDILNYFKNGLLERWLEIRGYETELQEVKEIDLEENNKFIIKKFVQIFHICINDEDIEKGIAILDYLEQTNYLNAQYKANALNKKQIIDDYHAGYRALIYHMEENRNNMADLKADIIQMEKEYFGLFVLDHKNLYYRISKSAPKAVFAILTRNAFRSYWIGNSSDFYIYSDIKETLQSVNKMLEILDGNIKIIKGNTQNIWQSIEEPEVKVMVLKIEPSAFIKAGNEFSECFSDIDVNNNFLIFNGLEYRCDNDSGELWYMEA